METTFKIHEHLEYEIFEQKKTSTIVKDLSRSYRCFKMDFSMIGDKLTLFISKINEDGSPKFEYSILNSYYKVGEEYEFDIKEVQEKGIILKDKWKTHLCPFYWAIKPEQKKIKLKVKELVKERNQLKFELPNQNEESSMKNFIDDFVENINILKETESRFYHFSTIDESIVNKYPILEIINKKYEILNFLNNPSQENILELSRLLVINDEDYELRKLVLTYNLLDTIKLEDHYSQKILKLIHENLEKFYLKEVYQDSQTKQINKNIDKNIAYLYFLENGSYGIFEERQTFLNKYEIFIQKEDSNGYLLQCYDNGCINKVEIRTILEKTFGKIYQHGLNNDAELLNYFIIKDESLIIAKSRRNNEEYIKVYSSDRLTTHEAIHSKGINILQKIFDNLIGYFVISKDYSQDLERIIYESRQNLGAKVNNKSYEKEIKILNKIL